MEAPRGPQVSPSLGDHWGLGTLTGASCAWEGGAGEPGSLCPQGEKLSHVTPDLAGAQTLHVGLPGIDQQAGQLAT